MIRRVLYYSDEVIEKTKSQKKETRLKETFKQTLLANKCYHAQIHRYPIFMLVTRNVIRSILVEIY